MTKEITLPHYITRAILSGGVPVVRDWRNIHYEEWTRAERNMYWIENAVVVPEGKLAGKPIKLALFQEVLIYAIYDNPNQIDEVILSMARKNGKTGLISALVLLHLDGPEAIMNSRIVSGANSRKQAAEVFRFVRLSSDLSPVLSNRIIKTESKNMATGLAAGTEYTAMSAEAKTAHGGNPFITILDETGQVKGASSEFIDAMTTAGGAYDGAMIFNISTQAQNDIAYLSTKIDYAKRYQPKNVVCHVYAADPDAELDDEEQWLYANPAMGLFKDKEYISKQAEQAMRSPARRNAYKNLQLNMRTLSYESFIDPDEWTERSEKNPNPNAKKPIPLSSDMKITAGLDLSKTTDLTAFVVKGEDGAGVSHVYPMFWIPSGTLEAREEAERTLLSAWAQEGYLTVIDGNIIDYEIVVQGIAQKIQEWGLVPTDFDAVGFDRWRIDDLAKFLPEYGLEAWLTKGVDGTSILREHGQGFKDMSPAIDALETSILKRTIRHGNHPLLNMCMFQAIPTTDPAGNRKLDKNKSTGRIDGAIALAMSYGVARAIDNTDVSAKIDEYLNNIIMG